MNTLKRQYRDLEMQVFSELRSLIQNSTYISKFCSEKAIKINVFDYCEITIINDKLTFLDSRGYHYSVYSDCSLEDLIDIINI